MIIATDNLSGYINSAVLSAHLNATPDQLTFIPTTLERDNILKEMLASQLETPPMLVYNVKPVWMVGIWFGAGELEWARGIKKRSLWHIIDHHKATMAFDKSGIFHQSFVNTDITTAQMVWELYYKGHSKPNMTLFEWVSISDAKEKLGKKKVPDYMKVMEGLLKPMASEDKALLVHTICYKHPKEYLASQLQGKA